VGRESYRSGGGLGCRCSKLCERDFAGDVWSASMAFVTGYDLYIEIAAGRISAVMSA